MKRTVWNSNQTRMPSHLPNTHTLTPRERASLAASYGRLALVAEDPTRKARFTELAEWYSR